MESIKMDEYHVWYNGNLVLGAIGTRIHFYSQKGIVIATGSTDDYIYIISTEDTEDKVIIELANVMLADAVVSIEYGNPPALFWEKDKPRFVQKIYK